MNNKIVLVGSLATLLTLSSISCSNKPEPTSIFEVIGAQLNEQGYATVTGRVSSFSADNFPVLTSEGAIQFALSDIKLKVSKDRLWPRSDLVYTLRLLYLGPQNLKTDDIVNLQIETLPGRSITYAELARRGLEVQIKSVQKGEYQSVDGIVHSYQIN